MVLKTGMHSTQLILIRHGETVWNRRGRWQGHLDSDLTPLGLQQADAVAVRLADVDFAALYSSDLGRAWRTAEAIATRKRCEIIGEPLLRERGLGVLQGLTYAEIEQQQPAEFERFSARDTDHVIAGGESIRQKHERAVRFMRQLVERHAGQTVVAVTHGGILDSVFRHAVGLPLTVPRRWGLYNASLNTFSHENGKWILTGWADIVHLRGTCALDDC